MKTKASSIFIALSFAIVLASCSSLSKEECLSANWISIGKKDALSGETESLNIEHKKSCSEYNIEVNNSDYLKGFKDGLKSHCTGDNGYYRGTKGLEKHKLCEQISSEYKYEYSKAFKEYSKEKAIEELKESLIEDNGGKECSSSSDCEVSDSCTFNKCDKSQDECSDDSDCTYETSCNSVSDWTEFSDNVSVNVCSEN